MFCVFIATVVLEICGISHSALTTIRWASLFVPILVLLAFIGYVKFLLSRRA